VKFKVTKGQAKVAEEVLQQVLTEGMYGQVLYSITWATNGPVGAKVVPRKRAYEKNILNKVFTDGNAVHAALQFSNRCY